MRAPCHPLCITTRSLLMQPLARLGAQVKGIDVVTSNIAIAKEHGSRDRSLRDLLSYQCSTLEDLMANDPSLSFDCVVASEVVEHVANVDVFIQHLCQVVKVREEQLAGCDVLMITATITGTCPG